MDNNTEAIEEIADIFGHHVLQANGDINKRVLAEIVFNDKEKLAQLNSIMHPQVANDFKAWAEEESKTNNTVFKEAALLFETGSYVGLDYTILITAPLDIRIERVKARDPFRSEGQIQQIIEKQWSDEKKSQLADFIIINDGSKPTLLQALEVLNQIKELQQT